MQTFEKVLTFTTDKQTHSTADGWGYNLTISLQHLYVSVWTQTTAVNSEISNKFNLKCCQVQFEKKKEKKKNQF